MAIINHDLALFLPSLLKWVVSTRACAVVLAPGSPRLYSPQPGEWQLCNLATKTPKLPFVLGDPTLSTPASCGPTWSHVCRPLAFMKPGLSPPLRDISAAPACMGPSNVQTCSSCGPRYQPLHLSRTPFLNSRLYSYLLLEEIVPTLSGSAYCWQCLQPLGLVSLTHSLVPGTQVKGNRGKRQTELVSGHIFKCT